MASAVLKRGEAIVWLPPRLAGERALATEPSLLIMSPPLAARSAAAATAFDIRRASLETLPELRSVRLVFDARDVTVLRARLPALPAARLQRALPNLLEEQLLQDPSSCACVLGPPVAAGQERRVAVIDRAWLDTVVQAFERRGIRVAAAWPAQALAGLEQGQGALLGFGSSVTVVLAEGEGIGLGVGPDPRAREQALVSAMQLLPVSGREPLLVYLQDDGWQEPLARAAHTSGRPIRTLALPASLSSSFDLMTARRAGALSRWLAAIDPRAWRGPLAWALAAALVAVVGLNAHWLRLREEQFALQARIDGVFRQVFPASTAMVDPVLQIQRHVTLLRTRAGQVGSDDFLPLLVSFSQSLGTQSADAVSGLEYRDGRLRIRLRPGVADSRAARDTIEQAARRHGLKLQFEGDREPLAIVTVLR